MSSVDIQFIRFAAVAMPFRICGLRANRLRGLSSRLLSTNAVVLLDAANGL